MLFLRSLFSLFLYPGIVVFFLFFADSLHSIELPCLAVISLTLFFTLLVEHAQKLLFPLSFSFSPGFLLLFCPLRDKQKTLNGFLLRVDFPPCKQSYNFQTHQINKKGRKKENGETSPNNRIKTGDKI